MRFVPGSAHESAKLVELQLHCQAQVFRRSIVSDAWSKAQAVGLLPDIRKMKATLDFLEETKDARILRV